MNSQEHKQIDIFINAIEEFLNNRIDRYTLEEVLNKTLSSGYNLYHFHHYLDDIDLRKQDEYYAMLQNVELGKFIIALRTRNFEEVKNISFLEFSK